MSKLAEKNREIIANRLSAKSDWKKDRWGNFTNTSGVYRVKFQDTSFRIEKKVVHEDSYINHSWIKIGGGYYKDVSIDGDFVTISGKKIRKEFL